MDYLVGQRVVAIVDRILPFGVFAHLTDGTPAYIRRRELSLAGDAYPATLVSIGQEIATIVTEPPQPDRRIELSYRRTLPDPWEAFARAHRPGDVVRCSVKRLIPEGIYVEFDEGVRDFIPLRELSLQPVEKPEEIVWIGDYVEVEIIRLDPRSKRAEASLRQHLARQHTIEKILERLSQQQTARAIEEAREEPDHPSEISQNSSIKEAGPVLVVEDDDDLREAFICWLSEKGCSADGANSLERACQCGRQRSYRTAFVDLNLREEDGIEFIRVLRETDARCVVGVMSGADELCERIAEMESLGVSGVYPKPLDMEEVERFLQHVADGERPRIQWHPLVLAGSADLEPFRNLADAMRSGQPLEQRFMLGIQPLIRIAPAEKTILFHLDSHSDSISIVAQAGDIPVNTEAVYALMDSPVKDLIREGRAVQSRRISPENEPRFRKLIQLLRFESCLGVPISAAGKVEYALFLFHREADALAPARWHDLQITANLFSIALEHAALDDRVQAASRDLLDGRLAACFSHEIYNKVSGLDLRARNIDAWLGRLEVSGTFGPDIPSVSQIVHELREMQSSIQGLRQTAEELRQLRYSSDELTVDVNAAVQQALRQVGAQLRRAGVHIQLGLDEGVPAARGDPIRLKHVFLNIILNAAQHLESRQEGRRALHISTRWGASNGDEGLWIQVRFADTGPGIHRRLWDKIFSLGFTTRPGGSGLGLYLARTLMESINGRILVEDSLMALGTTFLILLRPATQR